MCQMEYPDEATHQRNLKIRLDSAEFTEVRQRMSALILRGELRFLLPDHQESVFW
jgi:hypothetical protein